MGKVKLLDCTLRDGGYINDWNFGFEGIREIIKKLEQTSVDMIEVGFLKGDRYNPDKTVFPDVQSISNVISEKKTNIMYVAMIDMNNPIPLERVIRKDKTIIDGIRVIFKKDRIEEAYTYCENLQNLGYPVFVNFVSTDAYSDIEFIEAIQKFNAISPYAMTIVDTFGTIKRKDFLRLVSLADSNMGQGIVLGYHAHNNLQQAFGNAEALVDLNLKRDVVIDACVFGMGRGAGNLNLELFADYMNEAYDKSYNITPMLEIMDEHLSAFYKERFWGYSLPLYLSATYACHPNYAIFLAERDSLPVKAFEEIISGISSEDKMVFSKEKAEKYYSMYFENNYDDCETVNCLRSAFWGKTVLVIAPGNSIYKNRELIIDESKKSDELTICVNYADLIVEADYIFCSNKRKYARIPEKSLLKTIVTSNVDMNHAGYIVNGLKYAPAEKEIIDNGGMIVLGLLAELGVKSVVLAGMDGYSEDVIVKEGKDIKKSYSIDYCVRNNLIKKEIARIREKMSVTFLTPSLYE